MEYLKAKQIADSIIDKLRQYSEIINIAGSIRRQVSDVGDIEIVALPDYEIKEKSVYSFDLFNPTFDILFFTEAKQLGKLLTVCDVHSRQVKIMLPQQIKLDLFIPQKHDYWRQFVIRTGSRDFSHKVIAQTWRKLGWVGTENGLRLQKECYNIGPDAKPKWECKLQNPTLPPVWQSEVEFFEWLHLEYVEPGNRNY